MVPLKVFNGVSLSDPYAKERRPSWKSATYDIEPAKHWSGVATLVDSPVAFSDLTLDSRSTFGLAPPRCTGVKPVSV